MRTAVAGGWWLVAGGSLVTCFQPFVKLESILHKSPETVRMDNLSNPRQVSISMLPSENPDFGAGVNEVHLL